MAASLVFYIGATTYVSSVPWFFSPFHFILICTTHLEGNDFHLSAFVRNLVFLNKENQTTEESGQKCCNSSSALTPPHYSFCKGEAEDCCLIFSPCYSFENTYQDLLAYCVLVCVFANVFT